MLEEAYNVAHQEYLSELITEVEKADSERRHRECWKLINRITGRKSSRTGIIKAKSKEERISKWFNHFSNLLGKEPIVTSDPLEEIPQIIQNVEVEDTPFTIEEYQAVKKTLRSGKASGPDNISADILKYCNFDNTILSFANKLISDGVIPNQWSEFDLIPLPKTGDLSDVGNYRGISLSSIVSKTVNKMILNRIQPKIDSHLRKNQNGFKPSRSTTAHILSLRRIIEEVKANNLNAILIFIDFKKAFDSIHRTKMMNILKAYGVPPNLLNAIMHTYKNTRAKVVTPDGDTDYFDILAGVLQGDTLAPFLFAIVIDYCMRMAIGDDEEKLGFTLERRRSRRIKPTVVTDLDFADDIALLSDQIEQAHEFLLRVETEANKVGLHINTKKTEAMIFNIVQPVGLTSKSGEIIREVRNFKYLGGWMESAEKDFQVRKALAWTACHKLRKIWTSKIPRVLKLRLFTSTVESVLLYGSETWTLTKTLEKRLNGCYTRMLRMALNVSWRMHLTNKQLYQDLWCPSK